MPETQGIQAFLMVMERPFLHMKGGIKNGRILFGDDHV